MKILSFDIEDWFHILDNPATSSPKDWEKFPSRLNQSLDFILEELVKNNQKATFFILGWMAKKKPEAVKRINDAGFHIGSHSFAHQLVYEQSPAAFEEDLKQSIWTLEDIIAKKITTYRAPGFSITESENWALIKLMEFGIKADSSIFPATRGHGGFKSFPFYEPALLEHGKNQMLEFPMNSKSIVGKRFIFSGGGYFRLFPQVLLRKWFSNTHYLMTYFHPRDFDDEQPVLKDLSAIRKFKSYYGLKGAKQKFSLILKENQFIDMEQGMDICYSKIHDLPRLKLD